MVPVLKWIGYILYLGGSAVGGFPPPRKFAREDMPEEELIRILEDEFAPDESKVLEEWGFRVIDPLDSPRPIIKRHPRIPET